MSLEFGGQTAVVTGAASGIGRATAARLSEAGATVVGLDVSTEPDDRRGSFAESVRDGELLVGDVSNSADVERAVSTAEDHGPVDIAVNCAGIGSGGGLEQVGVDDLRQAFVVHVEGTFSVCKRVVPGMAERGRGAIVNTSSIAAAQGWRGTADYAPSKGAIESLTRELAAEFSPVGVRVNAVAPGFVKTGMNRDVWEADEPPKVESRVDTQTANDRTLLPYLGEPGDVAEAVVFLAGEAARFITGQILTVDGGWTVNAW